MIPKECKRLAEVDFPIARVSVFARAEKDSRIAHIPRLHVWPAARPGGACRTALIACLLPDPYDPLCPADFASKARLILSRFHPVKSKPDDLRTAILQFIGDFSDWDNAHSQVYYQAARQLVEAAYPESPVVVDPFAGGGAIPLEGLRLGCDVLASDLNPVACLINQVVLNDIPRYRDEMIESLPGIARKIKAQAEEKLKELYPRDAGGAIPIAYLWARTVRCEEPNCGCEIPLLRSLWLANRGARRFALRSIVERSGDAPSVRFEVFQPLTDSEVRKGLVKGGKATCPACDRTLPSDRVSRQLIEQRGGSRVKFAWPSGKRVGGARLIAVATVKGDETQRVYRLPIEQDYDPVRMAEALVREALETSKSSTTIPRFPHEPLPPQGTLGFRVQRYGMRTWGDLFTARQFVAVSTLCELIQGCATDHLKPLVALLISKVIDLNNALTEWRTNGERPAHMLSRWAIPMKWDFPEAVPISEASGSLDTALARTMHLLRAFAVNKTAPSVAQADCVDQLLPDESVSVWFTDPPYYDAIPYSDLSDFFFVWLRRALPGHPLLRDPKDASNPLTPKTAEAVQDECRKDENGQVKDKAFFERKMRGAFAVSRRILRDDGIGCVVFAHKTTEGWEALLSGLVSAGWVITASWPVATEMSTRMRARESAALATSVHLICRPRPADAPIGDWNEVLHGSKDKGLEGLSKRVASWMERLQSEGVRGADLVFACIGPALGIYSRYSKVVDAQEREIPLGGDPEAREPHKRGYLAHVWEVVGRAALEQVLGTAEAKARNGAAGALEEDARLTALFLWTLQATADSAGRAASQSNANGEEEADEEGDDEDEEDTSKKKAKGFTLIFDVVRRFAQPLGIRLVDWEKRIIETEKGVVRLIPVLHRAKQLFGEDGAEAVADRLERHPTGPVQMSLFPEADEPAAPTIRGRRRKTTADVSDESLRKHRGATTLDHVHAAMLLQSSGRANALRALLKSETERGPDFLRLANALSALYPKDSDEKRLLDAMLLAMPR
jgi:putative DNA methylase